MKTGGLFLVILTVTPPIHRWLICEQRQPQFHPSWKRARLAFTLIGMSFLAITACCVIQYHLAGGTFTGDQLATVGILWLAYAIWVVWRWFWKPNPDVVRSFETENISRFCDERHEMVKGKSAVTVLNSFRLKISHWLVRIKIETK